MNTVVITGATSGIGNLLVKEFAEIGYTVFAGFRNIKLKKELIEISENVIPFRIDMSKKWSISEAINFISEKTDKIDLLVNVAGYVVAGAMECLNVEKIKEQFEVNTFSHLELTQGLLDKLQGGKIINISSMASFGIFPFVAPYCASKRALDILFNSMQLECFGKDGGEIKVISVKPGAIRTPLWEKSIELNKDSITGNKKYEKEYHYLVRNAKKNGLYGLDPQKVVDLIVKINEMENPKTSYTVGFDARMAELVSRLPQDWINALIKMSLKQKMK